MVIPSGSFEQFLKQPKEFQISEDALELMENGSSIPDEYNVDFTFSYPNGEWCGFGAYYDRHELVLHSFKAKPKGKGVGTKCLTDLKRFLQNEQPPMGCRVIDEEDEASDFWEKMRDKKLIDYP